MPIKKLDDLTGGTTEGEAAFFHETFQTQDNTSVDTGLDSVTHAWANSAAGADNTANVESISGGSVTVELLNVADGAAITADEAVDVFAIGTA